MYSVADKDLDKQKQAKRIVDHYNTAQATPIHTPSARRSKDKCAYKRGEGEREIQYDHSQLQHKNTVYLGPLIC